MNRIALITAMGLAIVLMTGCSSTETKPTSVEDTLTVKQVKKENIVPTFFLKHPQDTKEQIFSAATGKSDDMQFAMDKALHDAKVTLGDKLGGKIGAEMKRFIADNGAGGMGTSVQETELVSKAGFKSVDVSGFVVENKAVFKEGGHFRAFVLVSLKTDDRDFIAPKVNTFSAEDHNKAQAAFERLK